MTAVEQPKYMTHLVIARNVYEFKTYNWKELGENAEVVYIDKVQELTRYDPKVCSVFFAPRWFWRRDWQQLWDVLDKLGFMDYLKPIEEIARETTRQ